MTDISEVEGQIPKIYGSDAVEIPGARKLLQTLNDSNLPWAVVTSGTRALLTGWLDVLKLAYPDRLVVAEDVANGKPDPTCYLLGRERLGLAENARIVVFEDAPSGIQAGKAAGFFVVALVTTHTIQEVKKAGADCIIRDLRDVSVQLDTKQSIVVEIRNSWNE